MLLLLLLVQPLLLLLPLLPLPLPLFFTHPVAGNFQGRIYSMGRSSSRMYHQYWTMGMMNDPANSTARTEVYLSRPSSVSSFFLKVLMPKSVWFIVRVRVPHDRRGRSYE